MYIQTAKLSYTRRRHHHHQRLQPYMIAMQQHE